MPGPVPVYQPSFPSEFVEQARAMAGSRTVPRRTWQRARLVVLLDENPATDNVSAGRAVGLHENSVRTWRRRWAAGDFSWEDRPRCGRPPRFSPGGAGRSHGRRLRADQRERAALVASVRG